MPINAVLLTCLGHTGKTGEAAQVLEEVLEQFPQFTTQTVTKIFPFRHQDDMDVWVEGLRKVGAPEANEQEEGIQPLPDKPSIAVLPFDNMSGDPEQEYFSDGMAEDLITDLSKISGLFVIARNSSFAFKEQTVDVKDIAGKLGVEHILEGSVRKMGDKLRVNVQLIDAASGGHLWAERYDGDMEDIFDFQDAIREQIVSALQVNLTPTDKTLTERKPTDSVQAYDLFLRGRSNLHIFAPESVREAIASLEKSIEIDPNFADAYSRLAFCLFTGWVHVWSGFDNGLERATELAEKAVELDRTSADAFMARGWFQAYLLRYDQSVENFEKATALAPNNAEVCALFGAVLNRLGNPNKGLEMLEKAFSLEVFAPPNWEMYAGCSYLLLRRYDEALTRISRAIERAPKFIPSYPHLAWAYVELNRLDDAREAIKTFLEIVPQFTVKKTLARWSYQTEQNPNRFLDALRKAGVPEG
jgi:adenylate cyclase